MSLFLCYIIAAALSPRVEGSFSFNVQHNRVAFPHRSTVGNVNTFTLLRQRSSSSSSHDHQYYNGRHDAIIIDSISFAQTAKSYIRMMRPVTIIQAVGAFLVGRLVILTSASAASTTSSSIMKEVPKILAASISIYLSYGFGMAVNDCADVAIDSMHEEKQHSWKGCNGFPIWNLFNLTIMGMYVLGLQRIFLVKNLICGYLAIAPLIGASLLGGGTSILGGDVTGKLYKLACIGFPLQVAREILKDIEDVDVDEGSKKTLPHVVGKRTAKWIAYSLVAMVNGAMIVTPYFWRIFKSTPNVYALSVSIGTPMCIWASILPLSKGQQMLKKSIYVLLLGMISALLNQAR
eukprot:scaffold5347_cov136-Skeletonema_menzelii.AAC.6